MNKAGEIQSQMCVVFGEEDNCYSGTLSGKIIMTPKLLKSLIFVCLCWKVFIFGLQNAM